MQPDDWSVSYHYGCYFQLLQKEFATILRIATIVVALTNLSNQCPSLHGVLHQKLLIKVKIPPSTSP